MCPLRSRCENKARMPARYSASRTHSGDACSRPPRNCATPGLNYYLSINKILRMSKEEDAHDQSPPVPDPDSSTGPSEAMAGDSPLEAPKRPRTVAQVAAFEKARAARAAKLAAKKKPPPEEPPRSVSPPLPSRRRAEEPAPEPTIQTKAVAPRKPRSDAGKKRGRLVRYEEEEEASPPEPVVTPPPYFVIV